MADFQRAAIAFRNLSDVGSIQASSSLILTPPDATLKNPHIARKWRGKSGSTEYLLTSYLVGIDTVMLRGVNLTLAGTYRVRVSSADTSGQAGDVFDSGDVAGIDPVYGTLLHLLPEMVDGYVRIDLTEPGASYIEAGRLFVGPRNQFNINFAWGWTERWIDRSQSTESRGGQTYIDPDVSYRCWSMNFEAISATFRNEVLQDLDRLVGTRSDFLMIANPASANLGKDSIWGRVQDVSPIVQPQIYLSDGAAFSKTFEIYERL
jgi:hypothetical protein